MTIRDSCVYRMDPGNPGFGRRYGMGMALRGGTVSNCTYKKRYRLDVGKFKFASRFCKEWNRLGGSRRYLVILFYWLSTTSYGCVALCYDDFSEKPKLSNVELGLESVSTWMGDQLTMAEVRRTVGRLNAPQKPGSLEWVRVENGLKWCKRQLAICDETRKVVKSAYFLKMTGILLKLFIYFVHHLSVDWTLLTEPRGGFKFNHWQTKHWLTLTELVLSNMKSLYLFCQASRCNCCRSCEQS